MRVKDRPTIYDVATAADVSIGTVSRAINQPAKVAAATRKRVLEAVRDLNYVPDEAAQRMGKARHRDDESKETRARKNEVSALPSIVFEGDWAHSEREAVSAAILECEKDGPWLCVKTRFGEEGLFAVLQMQGACWSATARTVSELVSTIHPERG